MSPYKDDLSSMVIESVVIMAGEALQPYEVVVVDDEPPAVAIRNMQQKSFMIIPLPDWPNIKDAIDELVKERGYE